MKRSFKTPVSLSPSLDKDEDFPVRDDFSDADQLRVGNDGIFMLAFFSEYNGPCVCANVHLNDSYKQHIQTLRGPNFSSGRPLQRICNCIVVLI